MKSFVTRALRRALALSAALRRRLQRLFGLQPGNCGEWWSQLSRRAQHAWRDPTGRRRRRLSPPLPEYCRAFGNRADWEAFIAANPALVDPAVIAACAGHVLFAGIDSETGPVPGYRIAPEPSGNHREGLRYRGLNSRKRAILHCLFRELGDPAQTMVYAPEAFSPMSRQLAQRLPRFVCSEYFPDEAKRQRHPGVRHEDLAALSFASASIDRILVNDVFEHVPDLAAVLSELQRVLAPGGILYSTFPFATNRDEHLLRARLVEGTVEHILPPDYHGDPLRPQGALVFAIGVVVEDHRIGVDPHLPVRAGGEHAPVELEELAVGGLHPVPLAASPQVSRQELFTTASTGSRQRPTRQGSLVPADESGAPERVQHGQQHLAARADPPGERFGFRHAGEAQGMQHRHLGDLVHRNSVGPPWARPVRTRPGRPQGPTGVRCRNSRRRGLRLRLCRRSIPR